jgi:hypothetical protein
LAVGRVVGQFDVRGFRHGELVWGWIRFFSPIVSAAISPDIHSRRLRSR